MIRLVLDTTAVRAYPNLDVGETLTQVAENGARFTIPLPCLVEAAVRDSPAIVDLLISHPAYQPTDLAHDHWPQLAAMVDVLGGFAVASALLLATVWRCNILTGEPGRYAALGDDPPVIGI
jgi:hypothetical protein